MKTKIQLLLDEYESSHKNPRNKLIHWFCVPLIFMSILGLIMIIPFPKPMTLYSNWAIVAFALVLIYYIRLSLPLFFGFLLFGAASIWINFQIYLSLGSDLSNYVLLILLVFILAWIGQFIGHKIEGKKPTFFKDIQFLLIGPAWLMHFVFIKLGIKY